MERLEPPLPLLRCPGDGADGLPIHSRGTAIPGRQPERVLQQVCPTDFIQVTHSQVLMAQMVVGTAILPREEMVQVTRPFHGSSARELFHRDSYTAIWGRLWLCDRARFEASEPWREFLSLAGQLPVLCFASAHQNKCPPSPSPRNQARYSVSSAQRSRILWRIPTSAAAASA